MVEGIKILKGTLRYECYGGYEHGIVIRPCIFNNVLVEEIDLDELLYKLDGQRVKITIEKVEE